MEIKTEKLIYKNSVLSCKSVDIQYKNRIVNGYLIVEPNNLTQRSSGITGIAILACYKKRVFLVKTKRPGYIEGTHWHWELPRGFIDEGESIEEAAIRELKEELKIENINICKISDYGCISPEPGVIKAINKIIKVEISDFDYCEAKEVEDEGIVDTECVEIEKSWIEDERNKKKLLDCATIIGLQSYVLEN